MDNLTISRESLLTALIALKADHERFRMMERKYREGYDGETANRINMAIAEIQQELGRRVFMVTDPCYVMDSKHYDEICDKQNCNFEGQTFPLESTGRKTGTPCTFHTIKGTPNGDGSFMYAGQDVGVDAGMLCVVEVTPEEAMKQRLGAKFGSLTAAEDAFPFILKEF